MVIVLLAVACCLSLTQARFDRKVASDSSGVNHAGFSGGEARIHVCIWLCDKNERTMG